jgi:hypothetical protein
MRIPKTLWIVVTVALAGGSVGCSLSIEQILAMQEGSGIDLAMVAVNGEIPQGRLVFEGGTVMQIDVSTSLLDYLDGTVDGDVAVLDLFFAAPSIRFLGAIQTGNICVILDGATDNGGTFAYDVVQQEAAFDVFVGTVAYPSEPAVGLVLQGGAFKFPFDLQATIPLTLVDALGLVSGTGSLSVTQAIDDTFPVPAFGGAITYYIHASGEVTLASADAFPFTPRMGECLEFLESRTL